MLRRTETRLEEIRYRLAADRVIWSLKRLLEKLNPSWHLQPRLPAGQTGGGQWTDGDALEESVGEASVLPVSDRPQPPGIYVVPRVDLRQEEAVGGHAIRRHADKSPQWMQENLRANRNSRKVGRRLGSFHLLLQPTNS